MPKTTSNTFRCNLPWPDAERLAAEILDLVEEGVVLVDPQGRMLAANHAARKILAIDQIARVPEDLASLLTARFAGPPAALRKSLTPDGTPRQLRHRVDPERTVSVRCHRLPTSDAQPAAIVVLIRSTAAPAPVVAPTSAAQLDDALAASSWNVAEAARRLGVSRTTIYKHLRARELRRPTK